MAPAVPSRAPAGGIGLPPTYWSGGAQEGGNVQPSWDAFLNNLQWQYVQGQGSSPVVERFSAIAPPSVWDKYFSASALEQGTQRFLDYHPSSDFFDKVADAFRPIAPIIAGGALAVFGGEAFAGAFGATEAGASSLATATAAGEGTASTAAAMTIAPEAGFEANVFAGAPIAAEGAGAADLVSTLQTTGQVASTVGTVTRILGPKPTPPAARPYQPGNALYYLGAPATPTGYPDSTDLGGMSGAGSLGGAFGQVATGLAVALVLVLLATHWRKLRA